MHLQSDQRIVAFVLDAAQAPFAGGQDQPAAANRLAVIATRRSTRPRHGVTERTDDAELKLRAGLHAHAAGARGRADGATATGRETAVRLVAVASAEWIETRSIATAPRAAGSMLSAPQLRLRFDTEEFAADLMMRTIGCVRSASRRGRRGQSAGRCRARRAAADDYRFDSRHLSRPMAKRNMNQRRSTARTQCLPARPLAPFSARERARHRNTAVMNDDRVKAGRRPARAMK